MPTRRGANRMVRFAPSYHGGLPHSQEHAMMTKADMIENLQKMHGDWMTKKMAGEVMDNMFDLMGKAIKKDKKFSYPSFGTFVVRTRKARKGRNPQTGAVINIKASKTVGFRPAKNLKEML